MLQMVSHGLIAASLFFLSGVTYERTHTLMMDKMGGIAKVMPKSFALFTAAAMASLALPGMSGFVGELMVFISIATSDVYSSSFKVVVVLLSAVGVILTPIYLLSMLREVFYGKQNEELVLDAVVADVKPRELFITACLLLPIIGIGFYPKLATQTYDVKTMQIATHARQVLPVVAEQQPSSLYSRIFTAPTLANSQVQGLVNIAE
jgi:NAD(P)H-quinone oxidoreductase subunit 4